MTPSNDLENNTAVLAVENASRAHQGVYSASYVGASPLHGSWMRLIVRSGSTTLEHNTYTHTHTHTHTHIYRSGSTKLEHSRIHAP